MKIFRQRVKLTVGTVIGALALVACGGSGTADENSENTSSGFEYGAPQEDVNAAVQDLEPVTLTYQGLSSSQNSPHAAESLAFKEEVEARSDGKIEIEIIWGQAVADYSEVFDALNDGRLDVAYTLPVYDPSRFPSFSDLITSTGELEMSPLVGELTASAALMEAAWNAEAVLSEFEEQGLKPLGSPINAISAPQFTCNTPGASASDWKGRQIRVGSTAFEQIVQNIEASPVSMEYTETYEALQRQSIDCTLIQTSGGVESGYFEVANNVSYPADASMPVTAGAYLTGSSVAELPLAYQQILFDSSVAIYSGNLEATTTSNFQAAETVKEYGGAIEAVDQETARLIEEASQSLTQQAIGNGNLPEDFDEQLRSAQAEWSQVAEELEMQDGGALETMDQWHDPADFNATPFMEQFFEEVASSHRPQ